MRPNMSEEKKTADSPTFVISTVTEGGLAGEPSKSRPYKKYVIIAVSGILAVAIILTAILVGMHLFTEAQRDIVRFSYNRDKNTKEDVTSDPNTNIVQYHVSSKTYEAWVINDFNRDIQVMKIHSDLGTNCYLTPLNRTTANDPSHIKPPSDNQPTNATYILKYLSASTPISDLTFLRQTARNACNGISTYWLFPICEGSESITGRQKRGRFGLSFEWGDHEVFIGVTWK